MRLDEMGSSGTPPLICISGLLNPQRDIMIHTRNLLIDVCQDTN